MSFSQTAYNSKHQDVPIFCFKADEWEDDQGKSYIKHRLDPDDLTSEKVSCAYYILKGTESKELYVRWRMDIDTKVCKNFNTEDSRIKVVVQMMDGEAKRVYEKKNREVVADSEFDRLSATGRRLTDSTYTTHKETDAFKKQVRESCLDAIRDNVFGTGKSGKYAYVFQKRYMRQYKFNQTHDKVKDYWLRLKELNEYLPYFPENAASSTIGKPQLIHEDELKEWLDQNLPQSYIDVAKTNLFDILGNPIADVIEYLQTIESQLPTERKSGTKKNVSFSSSAAATSSSKKRRGSDSGGKSGKGKQCPHCSKLHPTPKGDYSDCFVLARNKKNQAAHGDNRDPSERNKKARYTKSYNESSYKMMEGFQDMLEKASKGSSSKSRERMMRAAEIIAGNSSDSNSSSSASSSEDEKSRKKRSVKKFRRYKKK